MLRIHQMRNEIDINGGIYMSSSEMRGNSLALATIVKKEIEKLEQCQRELSPNKLAGAMDQLMVYLELLPADKETEVYQAIIELKKAAWDSGFYSGFERAIIGGYSICGSMPEVN